MDGQNKYRYIEFFQYIMYLLNKNYIMKRLFEISSEEKQRILEMHQSATKRNYLMEVDPIKPVDKYIVIPQVEPNGFGLDNKTASSFMKLARASTQFVFKDVYCVLRKRGQTPKEPMDWNEIYLSWNLYGITIQLGHPWFRQYMTGNYLYVNDVKETVSAQPNVFTDRCQIKFFNPKKEFGDVNTDPLFTNGGAAFALDQIDFNLDSNSMLGKEKINTVKMTEYLNTLITQEVYNSAFKKLWIPTLNPSSTMDESRIKTIQSSWVYTWLKSKYGSSQPTGAQPTGAQPTGTTPAR